MSQPRQDEKLLVPVFSTCGVSSVRGGCNVVVVIVVGDVVDIMVVVVADVIAVVIDVDDTRTHESVML